jgi:hypothetical protein
MDDRHFSYITKLRQKKKPLVFSIPSPTPNPAHSLALTTGWGEIFFHFSFVPNMFPSSFQWVPFMFPMCSPRVFLIAPRFNPICFAQSPHLPTYIGGPKGVVPHLSMESSILGNLRSFNFFCDGPIKLAHCKKIK